MRKIAVLNQKGGVGKTTTVANVAAAIAAKGARVVVIDLDPQAHLTIHLGVEPQEHESGAYRVLGQSASFVSEIMMVRANLWLLPSNINLVGAETELVNVVGREIILKEAIEPYEDMFDYCLIDCAPSLGLLTLNALAAVEEVLIPLQPHFLALQGFGKLLQTVELVNRRINPQLKVFGILLCMFDSRISLANEVKSDIEQFLNTAKGTNSAWADARVLSTVIRRNIRLAEAPSYGQTIFEYDPSCNGAQDYRRVSDLIMGLPLDTSVEQLQENNIADIAQEPLNIELPLPEEQVEQYAEAPEQSSQSESEENIQPEQDSVLPESTAEPKQQFINGNPTEYPREQINNPDQAIQNQPEPDQSQLNQDEFSPRYQ